MCRLLAYLGMDTLPLGDLIEKPANSLINQSKKAKEGSHDVNADGFGISWYDQKVDSEPALFKSIQPAWNDRNLLHLSKKVTSNCFLGHIRASTVGDVTFNNCHPFAYLEYSFAHNGTIRQFEHLRRDLINFIDEEFFLPIKAQTDSEHLFFLIMHFLKYNGNLKDSVLDSYRWVIDKQKNKDAEFYSKLNTVTTDGNILVATRYASKENDNLSLYYTTSKANSIVNNEDNKITALVVASEPLNDFKKDWVEIEPNSILVASKRNSSIEIEISSINS